MWKRFVGCTASVSLLASSAQQRYRCAWMLSFPTNRPWQEGPRAFPQFPAASQNAGRGLFLAKLKLIEPQSKSLNALIL